MDLSNGAAAWGGHASAGAASRQAGEEPCAENTFATPYCQRPLTLGADLVVHSLTKDISGFGTDMGGVVVGPQRYHGPLLLFRKDFGGVLAPKSAWPILVYGLLTLAARLVNQQKSAMRVAHFLAQQPLVARVAYPGLETFPQYALARQQMVSDDGKFAPGSLLYFVLQGDATAAHRAAEHFLDAIAAHAYSVRLVRQHRLSWREDDHVAPV